MREASHVVLDDSIKLIVGRRLALAKEAVTKAQDLKSYYWQIVQYERGILGEPMREAQAALKAAEDEVLAAEEELELVHEMHRARVAADNEPRDLSRIEEIDRTFSNALQYNKANRDRVLLATNSIANDDERNDAQVFAYNSYNHALRSAGQVARDESVELIVESRVMIAKAQVKKANDRIRYYWQIAPYEHSILGESMRKAQADLRAAEDEVLAAEQDSARLREKYNSSYR